MSETFEEWLTQAEKSWFDQKFNSLIPEGMELFCARLAAKQAWRARDAAFASDLQLERAAIVMEAAKLAEVPCIDLPSQRGMTVPGIVSRAILAIPTDQSALDRRDAELREDRIDTLAARLDGVQQDYLRLYMKFHKAQTEITQLRAETAAMLEKADEYTSILGMELLNKGDKSGWNICDDIGHVIRALIPTSHAAALIEHDMKVHKQGFDAGFEGAERAAFDREREYVKRNAAALDERLAERDREWEAACTMAFGAFSHDSSEGSLERAVKKYHQSAEDVDERIQQAVREFAQVIVAGFDCDPVHSDLDDEQPIHGSMTLGDYRRARLAAHRAARQAPEEKKP